MLLIQYQVLSAVVLMLQRETAGRAAAAERVHCQAERSHGKH